MNLISLWQMSNRISVHCNLLNICNAKKIENRLICISFCKTTTFTRRAPTTTQKHNKQNQNLNGSNRNHRSHFDAFVRMHSFDLHIL